MPILADPSVSKNKHRCVASLKQSVWFSSKDKDVTHLLCTLRAYALEPENRLPTMQRESRRTVAFQGICSTKNMGKTALD